MTAAILPLFPPRTLATIGRRVVKRWSGELVLTNGASLELWRECPTSRYALTVEGKAYAFVRPLNARELWFPG
jgi:hypothetical protein